MAMHALLRLTVALATLALPLVSAVTPHESLTMACPKTDCPPVPECPARPGISCLIDRSLTAGEIDVRLIIRNQAFAVEFGSLSMSLNTLETNIRTGMATDFTDIMESLTEIHKTFQRVLHESCLIPVRYQLQKHLDADLDETLDFYYRNFLRLNSPPADCPLRLLVVWEFKKAVENGEINIFRMIRDQRLSATMFNIPPFIDKLLYLIETRVLLNIDEMSQYMDELLYMFTTSVEARCVLRIRTDLRLLIEDSIDRQTEVYVRLMKNQGASNPQFCPMRDQMLDIVKVAKENGTIDMFSLIKNENFFVEFGALDLQLKTLFRDIRTRMVPSVFGVLEPLSSVYNKFVSFVDGDPGCYVRVRRDVRLAMELSWHDFTVQILHFYQTRGGFLGTAGCPKRMNIFFELVNAEKTGDYNFSQLIQNPAFVTEFGPIAQAYKVLQNDIQIGGVVDRRTVTERVWDMVESLRSVFDVCMLDESLALSRVVDDHFDDVPELFCPWFKRRILPGQPKKVKRWTPKRLVG